MMGRIMDDKKLGELLRKTIESASGEPPTDDELVEAANRLEKEVLLRRISDLYEASWRRLVHVPAAEARGTVPMHWSGATWDASVIHGLCKWYGLPQDQSEGIVSVFYFRGYGKWADPAVSSPLLREILAEFGLPPYKADGMCKTYSEMLSRALEESENFRRWGRPNKPRAGPG